MSRIPRLNRNIRMGGMTRPTWLGGMARIPILTALTMRRRVGRLNGRTFLGGLTMLTSVPSMKRLTGNDRKEGLYRLAVTDTHSRMTRSGARPFGIGLLEDRVRVGPFLTPTLGRLDLSGWIG